MTATMSAPVQKKSMKVPSTLVIIFMLMIALALLTYVIPAGKYDMVTNPDTGVSSVDPTSFHFLPQTPVGPVQFFKAIYQGCLNGSGIIFMILLLGAYTNVIIETGAIGRGINLIVKKYDKNAIYAIPILMLVLCPLGASAIIVDASIGFIPIGLVIAKKLKLDPIAGVAIIYLGCYSGWNCSFMAPTSVQVAQNIAGLPLLSGMAFRVVVMLIETAITIWFVMRYVRLTRDNRAASYVDEETFADFDRSVVVTEDTEFTWRDGLCLTVFIGGIALYIFGIVNYKWGMDMMLAIMLGTALLCGVISKMKPDAIAKAFTIGIQQVSFGAIIVGVGSSLAVIMHTGNIIHTIIYGASLVMGYFHGAISALVMFYINLAFNFFVPSGPAQAAIVMPIMAPLSDVLGITRQVAVLAFQYGDGLSNCIIPTSGTLMGCLGMARVPYVQWLKFMLPLFYIWVALCSVAILVAVFTGYS